MRFRLACIAISLAGCIEPALVNCDDGTVCPEASMCSPIGCLTRQQVEACAGLPDGAPCTLALGEGVCRSEACFVGKCGDGVVGPGETCDDGNTLPLDGCLPDCQLPGCGDGFVDTARDEVCDDGNRIDNDGCARDCLSDETCGNGVRDATEQCDDGNTSNGDLCSATCVIPGCGDGLIDTAIGEVCDDGNVVDGDGCARDCRSDESCGNGVRDPGESCDEGSTENSTAPDMLCRPGCELRKCGDAIIDPVHLEVCDDGNNVSFDACRADCTLNVCGDGFQLAVGPPGTTEECDDGNAVGTDFCTTSCKFARCGDGHLLAAGGNQEQCDDGNASSADACPNTCAPATCGDGFEYVGVEQCDDGNNGNNQDACIAGCFDARCGDAFVFLGVEACDDGNLSNTDACVNTCALAICGDGFVRPGFEQCDDGNAINTDACPNSCSPTCGDGFVHGTEQCDDGNNHDNSDACLDGCIANRCGDSYVHVGVEECDSNMPFCTADCELTCGDPSWGAVRVIPEGGSCFALFESPGLSFDAAENACQMHGGHLASISNPAENGVVLTLDDGHYIEQWIGATDVGSPGTYYWTDGLSIGYTNWAAAPPPGRCLYMYGDGVWYADFGCDTALSYVCKLPP